MSLAAEARVLLALARGQRNSSGQAESLEAFYRPQARHYDRFRERLLHGRRELLSQLPLPPDAVIAEMGAGTGRNLLFLGDGLERMERAYLIDLCPSLLAVARERWGHDARVETIAADAARWQAPQPLDAVIFSYSLTMIGDWRGALARAAANLKPGGVIAVVDFTLSEDQRALSRWFWRRWFGHDGVALGLERLAALDAQFTPLRRELRRAPVPYLPGLRVPCYLFVGVMAADQGLGAVG